MSRLQAECMTQPVPTQVCSLPTLFADQREVEEAMGYLVHGVQVHIDTERIQLLRKHDRIIEARIQVASLQLEA